ncbi:BREX-1 system adenine-specific DNA-methyltransferase PglX [Paenibacillus polymyxa]|uniref:BREX-1 system adenine-specific DNA-methyltransferase PglX n=1 Tax=Paenibacillus polymyxa TaxID=1406 RepID=UPI0025B65C71|nr:BREX-1 system adenine-specific DNA-methyltransferase PglX [Paenibacillus polymyxa]MDN4076366.1 BREX-1 system adenine-specific DNA-methyltransferase PglX [Paenibacillus polymyxa]MDN4101792.1 BREX-1 system adenine-specific DNA-methyltransferase PglX [Paenibacillus polymyxa]MDN4112009.1 BREX-1 system adenine-specific DNA-methyltransferase PglX [Paenibacillus polymyxa]
MNKTALKNFAINARKELVEKVKAKAFKIGITEENIKKAQFESSDAIYIDGKQLSVTEKKQREKLISRIKEIGFKQVVEEVAYTWFNRFTALRFMEINNYLPTKVRVLSSSNPGDSEPDIIKEALTVDLDIDKELIYELKLNNKTEELFKYLVIKQCNGLNKILPFMFETIDDYKEILFPDGLLTKDSFLRDMTDVTVIPESDWGQVEIIGWLYQYYISEEKDRVIKAKKKYKTEEIPYATQLFTPEWIVRYMVQNTLGRYWIESHPDDKALIEKWEFYLGNSASKPDFEQQLAPFINKELRVEDIKCFDPAMGSGHILVYMFDVLFEIYSKCGYMEKEIPRLIIENNLYGLDIDDRAYQLASFSVVMKAIQYNSRFLRSIEKEGLTLNLASIRDTNQLNDDDIAYLVGKENKTEVVSSFINKFKDAKICGSLINSEDYDENFLYRRLKEIQSDPITDVFEIESRSKIVSILPCILKQAEIMSIKYDIMVTNPPYIGNKYLNEVILDFLGNNYSETKADLFSAFIEYSFSRVKENGHIGFMTPFVWMFISSYEKLRTRIINNKNISSLIELEYSAFEEATVPICTFTLRNYYVDVPGNYIKLSDFKGAESQPIKVLESQKERTSYRFVANAKNFNKIPGNPIAYWASEGIFNAFDEGVPLGDFAEVKRGMTTSDNNKFLRFWPEVAISKIYKNANSDIEALESKAKWFPYSKGGGYRKWYGYLEYVVNWENSGFEVIEFAKTINKSYTRTIVNISYFFKPSVGFSYITSGPFSMRWIPEGCLYDSGGPGVFADYNKRLFLLGCMNSKPAQKILKLLNPTINLQIADVIRLPLPINYENVIGSESFNGKIEKMIEISKNDWDSFETSWDFKRHPLVNNHFSSIEDAFMSWSRLTEERFSTLKTGEEELNDLFIKSYNLQNELTPEVLDEDITINRANRERDIKSFVSYAIGCIFGRYSVDKEGLVYAGGKFDSHQYLRLPPDEDNVLPILNDDYFEDDIVSKFVDFVKVVYGVEPLSDNIDYIADSLVKKDGETSREAIRRYFITDFFKDHLRTYKKKPIYWLFTSGKQKAFNCLIYMHRYDKSTLSRIRTDYLHELQIRMDAEKKTLLDVINGDGTAKEISNAKKELKSLDLKIEELRAYDEKLHHMADMQIEIDLDDGVAVNYAKFEGLVALIK